MICQLLYDLHKIYKRRIAYFDKTEIQVSEGLSGGKVTIEYSQDFLQEREELGTLELGIILYYPQPGRVPLVQPCC
jgi:hypothetical protein